MSSASVSVIIPAYKCAATLPASLESIAAQTIQPAEILICDDGSPDDTWAYLQSLGPTCGGIPLKIFRQANAGAGAARNRCLVHASGEFIAFLDADDTWLPTKLERSLQILEQTGATFVAHNFNALAPGGQPQPCPCAAISRRRDWLNRGNIRTHYFYRGFIGILTVVMHRQALLNAGGFDSSNRYALDWECWHAVLAANPDSHFVMFDAYLATYTLNPHGLTSKGISRLKERLSYLSRYVRGVAKAGRVPWPVLLLRGWLTVFYETLMPVLRGRQWRNLFVLLATVPLQVAQIFISTLGPPYRRPNFLANLASNE